MWGATGADRYLLDQRRGKWSFPETREQIRLMCLEWPQTQAILVEDKANGSAIVAELQHSIGRMVPVNPEGGKLVRAHAVSPQVEAGNVYIPHPATAPWLEDFIEECTMFPAGRHDDQVDCLTQALRRVQGAANRRMFLNPYNGELSPVPVEYRISAI
jgi:predicted phage terminase large subunit-like protein